MSGVFSFENRKEKIIAKKKKNEILIDKIKVFIINKLINYPNIYLDWIG